jgi:hypothetical protein
MSVSDFLSAQESPRKELLSAIHETIIDADKKATATVGKMMRQEMILYKCAGNFKYGLAGGKNHMSLHAMPIYCSPALHTKYAALLNNAKFQKGCINFIAASDMPLKIVKELMKDCAKTDMAAMLEKYKKSKKEKVNTNK